MSDDKALVPIEQRSVDFYGDTITVVMVQIDEQHQVFVPIRPICDFLGVTRSPQRRRIMRDAVLAKKVQGVTVTVTAGSRQEMLSESNHWRAKTANVWYNPGRYGNDNKKYLTPRSVS